MNTLKKQYRVLTREQLVAELGSQCSPHRSYEAYVIGPDVTGQICHVGSYRSYAGARTSAAAMNQKQ